jgi:hypothetical protein
MVAISYDNGGGNQHVAGSVVQIKLENVRFIRNGTNNWTLSVACSVKGLCDSVYKGLGAEASASYGQESRIRKVSM